MTFDLAAMLGEARAAQAASVPARLTKERLPLRDPFDIPHLYVSHSSLSMFQSCARKLEFRKFHMHNGREDSLAAMIGRCLHAGYQKYLISRDANIGVFEMMCKYPFNENVPAGGKYSIEECYASLMSMIDANAMDEYELATILCADGVTRPANEVRFHINIRGFSLDNKRNIPVTYVGYIDSIMYSRRTHEFVVLDVKTTKSYTADLSPQYQFNPQCLPYGFVLERVLGHEISNFDVKYLVVKVDIKDPTTRLYGFTKTHDDTMDWFRTLYLQLQQIKTYRELRWFPRNGNNCFSFNRACQFMDACGIRNSDEAFEYLNASLGELPAAEVPEEKPWITMDLALEGAA